MPPQQHPPHRQQHQQPPDSSGRLVYADPRSLPSYPSPGFRDDDAAASIAASLGWKHNPQASQPQPSLDASAASAAIARAQFNASAPSRPSSAPANPVSLRAAAAAASAALSPRSPTSTSGPEAQKMAAPPPPSLPAPAPASAQVVPIVVEPPAHLFAAAQNSRGGSSSNNNSNANANANSNHADTSRTAAALAAGSAAGRHQRTISIDSAVSSSSAAVGSAPSSWGSSAANQAFRNSRSLAAQGSTAVTSASPPPSPRVAQTPSLIKKPSLHAAQGAMKSAAPSSPEKLAATGSRLRAISSPTAYRHQKSQSSPCPEHVTGATTSAANTVNALGAATVAYESAGSRFSFASEAGSVPYTNMNRQMYTAEPPVSQEVEEQRRNSMLHASAVAMAKRMYNPNGDRSGVSAGQAGDAGPFTTTLQEAAYKLAQERLDKLEKEHMRSRAYREHYVDPALSGTGGSSAASAAAAAGQLGRRSTIRSRLRRRRSSSDSEVVEDRKRSLEIRNQMSLLTDRISEVDQEKRRRDRQSVLAAAQRNVSAQLHDIDEQVFAETGKVHPSLLSSWEHKAHAAAQARRDARVGPPPSASNRIDLGGGKFMDRAEINKIAARRVQPLLDEINEKAEKEHERQAVRKQEEADRKEEAMLLKARDKEMKELYQKLRQEDKEKERAAKREKKETKTAKGKEAEAVTDPGIVVSTATPPLDEQARATSPVSQAAAAATAAEATTSTAAPSGLSKLFVRTSKLQTRNRGNSTSAATAQSSTGSHADKSSPQSPQSDESSPTSPTSRVRHWLKTRFRPRAKSAASAGTVSSNGGDGDRGFIGGHTLATAEAAGMLSVPGRSGIRSPSSLSNRNAGPPSVPEDVEPSSSADRASVSQVGEGAGAAGGAGAARAASSHRNSHGSVGSHYSVVESSSGFVGSAIVAHAVSNSSDRDGSHLEVADVVRDRAGSPSGDAGSATFTPPRSIRDPAARKSPSPIRDSRFLENLEE